MRRVVPPVPVPSSSTSAPDSIGPMARATPWPKTAQTRSRAWKVSQSRPPPSAMISPASIRPATKSSRWASSSLNQPSVPSIPGGVTSDGAWALNEPEATIWRAAPTR